MSIIRLAIALWLYLSVLNAVGGLVGWYQLRTDRSYRASLYLSRILIAESIRASLTFVGIYYASPYLVHAPIYVALSTFSVILLTGAIWGWLLYLRGVVNGGGWPELLQRLQRQGDPLMDNKTKEQDEEKPKPAPAPTPVSTESGDGGDDDNGNDRGGVTDGPGKTP